MARRNEIEELEALEALDSKVKKKRRCIYNFLSTEEVAALEAVSDKLEKIECDMIPVAEVKVQNSAMLEMVVPLEEAAAKIVPDN